MQPARATPVPMPSPRVAQPAPDLQACADEAAALLRTLAHANRLLLLCQLVEGERSVGDLGLATGLEQPSLSQQLGVLRGQRLVATRRAGKQIFYRLHSPSALAVLQVLHQLYRTPPQPAGRALPRSTRNRPSGARSPSA